MPQTDHDVNAEASRASSAVFQGLRIP